jgi:hypothetical protein
MALPVVLSTQWHVAGGWALGSGLWALRAVQGCGLGGDTLVDLAGGY